MTGRFEYKIVVSDTDDESDEQMLNEHGEDGWQLVSAVADVRANEEPDLDNVPVTVFYFKRNKD